MHFKRAYGVPACGCNFFGRRGLDLVLDYSRRLLEATLLWLFSFVIILDLLC